MTFNPEIVQLNELEDGEELFVDMVIQLSEDGTSVSIMFVDVPVLDVDALFEELGTEEARDDISFRLAQAVAHRAAQRNGGN